MKMIDDILGLVRRYSPIALAHLLFLIFIWLFVVDRTKIPEAGLIWPAASKYLDAVLKAIGLSIDRWYVLAAFLLAYLTLFEWLRSVATSLPGVRLTFLVHWKPGVLAQACRVLRLPPDQGDVRRSLEFQIERSEENIRRTNQRHPYQWLLDRQSKLTSYYGTVLIAMAVIIAWYIAGATLARSADRLLVTVLLLTVCALVLRWMVRNLNAERLNATAFWALREYERHNDMVWADPLASQRERAMRTLAEDEAAIRRHPAPLMGRLLYRLLGKYSDGLRRWLVYPEWEWERDWDLIASSATRLADESVAPPQELQVQSLTARFTALLERPGTGLFALAPRRSRLALKAVGAGAIYAFDSRAHQHGVIGLELVGGDGPLQSLSDLRLRIVGRFESGFITRVGTFPIEDLILGYQPDEKSGYWEELLLGNLEGLNAQLDGNSAESALDGMKLDREAELAIGSSYLLAAILRNKTKIRVAIQCFQVKDRPYVLVAWGFIDIKFAVKSTNPIPPWWRLSAWRGAIKRPI